MRKPVVTEFDTKENLFLKFGISSEHTTKQSRQSASFQSMFHEVSKLKNVPDLMRNSHTSICFLG